MKFDKNDIIIAIVMWGLVLIFILYAFSLSADETKVNKNTSLYMNKYTQVESYIEKFFGKLYPKRTKRAIFYIPVIIEAGEKHKIDPLLIAVVMGDESSFRIEAEGAKDEQGLMQIKNWPRKLTPEENINRGAALLREYLNRCGTLLQALSAYQSGRCKPILKSARRRLLAFERAGK
jgi:soluble lytic murein transglycosylase-like protein